MVRTTFFMLLLVILLQDTYSQSLRYTQKVFDKSDTLKNVEYAQPQWLNNPVGISILDEYNVHEGEMQMQSKPLLMDIFMPSGDTVSKRPAILFAHSGGFLIGSRHNEDMVAMCDSFAQRGYVTATIDYRIGMGALVSRFFGIPVGLSVNEENGTRAVYRAIQDSRAAIRFLKSKADIYGIDTTKIYMVGSSAGAFVALHNIYMDKEDEIPLLARNEPALGSLDTIGVQGYNGQANAIVSLWGALQNPDLIEEDETPVFLVHGEDDDVVYFKKGMPLKSSVPDISILDFSVPETYGSFCIDTALTKRNIKHKNYFVPGKKHEFYGVDTGDFEENGPNQYWDSIHTKISDFFFDLFKPSAGFDTNENGLEVVFTNTSTSDHFIHWDFGDGNVSRETNPVHRFENHGSYTITLTSCNDNIACDTISKSVYLNPVNVNTLSPQSIEIFPNPATTKIYIKGMDLNTRIEVYNLQGSLQDIRFISGSKTIDISQLTGGVYIMRLATDQELFTKMFLKVEQ